MFGKHYLLHQRQYRTRHWIPFFKKKWKKGGWAPVWINICQRQYLNYIKMCQEQYLKITRRQLFFFKKIHKKTLSRMRTKSVRCGGRGRLCVTTVNLYSNQKKKSHFIWGPKNHNTLDCCEPVFQKKCLKKVTTYRGIYIYSFIFFSKKRCVITHLCVCIHIYKGLYMHIFIRGRRWSTRR